MITLNAKQQVVVEEELERRWTEIEKTNQYFRKQYFRLQRENEDIRGRLLRRAMKDYPMWNYPNK